MTRFPRLAARPSDESARGIWNSVNRPQCAPSFVERVRPLPAALCGGLPRIGHLAYPFSRLATKRDPGALSKLLSILHIGKGNCRCRVTLRDEPHVTPKVMKLTQ